jgi:hypothetical protein
VGVRRSVAKASHKRGQFGRCRSWIADRRKCSR